MNNTLISSLTKFHQNKLYLNFLKDRQVASIIPSSNYTAAELSEQINFDIVKNIVELGMGNGVITRSLLNQMSPNSQLMAFETCSNLVHHVKQKIKDSRLSIFQMSAEKINLITKRNQTIVDVVICGIPFSLIEEKQIDQILRNVKSSLKPNGTFIIYQANMFPFWNSDKIQNLLSQYFQVISTSQVWHNFPPLRVITCKNTDLSKD